MLLEGGKAIKMMRGLSGWSQETLYQPPLALTDREVRSPTVAREVERARSWARVIIKGRWY